MPAPGDQHTSWTNPFEEAKPRISEWTAKQIATISSKLDKQLGPEYISSRAGPGGSRVHYLTAEKCIGLANEVFGFNGWSSSIQNIQVDFADENPQTQRVSIGLSVIVRVTLRDGTYHEDIGYGSIENAKGKAMAFEKAKKEGTTDGLKRALRSFGNVLGNCIYDQDYVKQVTKVKAQPVKKFDQDNLHRHADFVKRESASTSAAPTNITAPTAAGTTTSTTLPKTEPSESFEEDFLGELDEADFCVPGDGHPDEVMVPNPAVVPPAADRPPQMQPPPRGSSTELPLPGTAPPGRPLRIRLMPPTLAQLTTKTAIKAGRWAATEGSHPTPRRSSLRIPTLPSPWPSSPRAPSPRTPPRPTHTSRTSSSSTPRLKAHLYERPRHRSQLVAPRREKRPARRPCQQPVFSAGRGTHRRQHLQLHPGEAVGGGKWSSHPQQRREPVPRLRPPHRRARRTGQPAGQQELVQAAVDEAPAARRRGWGRRRAALAPCRRAAQHNRPGQRARCRRRGREAAEDDLNDESEPGLFVFPCWVYGVNLGKTVYDMGHIRALLCVITAAAGRYGIRGIRERHDTFQCTS
ncbi:hypothetical protein ACCO45_005803 [Purpureocillium lilacinum]|uniref:Uncharacterized protein n=1 Tax=Purpureocillium lilacinum TaxID=33203 RepID=A0ACC4DZ34_PURLI